VTLSIARGRLLSARINFYAAFMAFSSAEDLDVAYVGFVGTGAGLCVSLAVMPVIAAGGGLLVPACRDDT